MGAGGVNVSGGKSKIDSNFQSVTEQSGIKAGDGGFNVYVKGNTDLKGAAITSTDKAVQEAKNSFVTGSLTQSDIQNQAHYDAKSISVTTGVGTQPAGSQGTGIGFGLDSGDASSTSQSGISGIAGNADVRTGDKETGIGKIFDQAKVQKDIDAQTQITLAFSQQAPKAVATFAGGRANDLRDQAKNEPDLDKRAGLMADARKWDEGGVYRVALHTATGALSGGVAGALGAGATSGAAPLLTDLQNNVRDGLINAGVDPTTAALTSQAIALGTAAGMGALVSGGSTAGAGMGLAIDANNRMAHQSEYDFAKKNAKVVADALSKKEGRTVSVEEAEGRIIAEIQRNSDKQTADAAGGKHDYGIRSIVSCQNLNCKGDKNDPQYANHDYNSEFIAPNQAAYNAGQAQLGQGQTYNDLVTGNIKKDPVGTTIAGTGMIGLGLVTGTGLPALGMAGAGAGIGFGVNGTFQLALGNPFDWFSFGIAGVTGAASSGLGFIPAMLINTGGVLASSSMQGKNPNGAMAGAAVGTAMGFPIGSKIEGSLGNVMNPWYRQEWKDIGMGISTWVPKSAIPSWAAGIGSSIVQEKFGPDIQKKIEGK